MANFNLMVNVHFVLSIPYTSKTSKAVYVLKVSILILFQIYAPDHLSYNLKSHVFLINILALIELVLIVQ